MESQRTEFSFRTRAKAIQRFQNEIFDVLIIGGGITGAAAARDAASRGLRVALVEKQDFAWGTSSRSSKLIHGGLRYLKNLELGLVFEALAERAFLLKTAPHLVRPVPFFFPVYDGDPQGQTLLSFGLWLYDFLALFRTPGFHKRLSKKTLMEQIPFLSSHGLQGGFRYYDASMCDDALVVETLRSAHCMGAAVANYVEAVRPIWEENQVVGFEVQESESHSTNRNIELRAHGIVLCVGPWTEQMGLQVSSDRKKWLSPSKGVHLVFDLKRIPIPGALVMSHPLDGRISFVVPRRDLGAGVVIVGTTDGPTSGHPENAHVERADINYLIQLLCRYFPSLDLKTSDILSTYVGVRLLIPKPKGDKEKECTSPQALQKLSREHWIGLGQGGVVMVVGGKYTTHRKMGRETIDYLLKLKTGLSFQNSLRKRTLVRKSQTQLPVNPNVSPTAILKTQEAISNQGWTVPAEFIHRYGLDSLEILKHHFSQKNSISSFAMSRPALSNPEGFPYLLAQLRYAIQSEMVLHLEDFYLRRIPLYLSRSDHGLPWAEILSRVWAEERGMSEIEREQELIRLRRELEGREKVWS